MTIDSKYLGPQVFNYDEDLPYYTFEHESIGSPSIKAYMRYEDLETVFFLEPALYSVEFGGKEPIYDRGVMTLSGDYDFGGSIYEIDLGIYRKTLITQELDLIPYTPTPTENIEFGLDKLTLILQEIEGSKCDCPWGGTEPLPPVPGPVPIQCQPYDCAAYEDFLDATDGIVVPLYDNTGTFDYPFSTNGTDDKLRFYQNFVAGPNILTDWSNDGFSGYLYKSTNSLTTANLPDFCGGEVTQMVSINSFTSGFVPYTLVRPASDNWGNYTIEMIIVARDVTGPLEGELIYGDGKRYRGTRNGQTKNYDQDDVPIKVEVSSSGEDVILTITMSQPNGSFPVLTESLTSVGTLRTFNKLRLSIESTAPFEAPDPTRPGFYLAARDATITVQFAGDEIVLSGRQSYGSIYNASYPFTNLAPYTHELVTQQRLFYECKISVAYLKWGPLNVGNVDESDLAFERTYATYTLPPECD